MDETKSIKRSFNPNGPIVVGFFLVAAAAIMGYIVYLAFGSSRDQREKQIANKAGEIKKVADKEPETRPVDPAVLKENRLVAELRRKRIRTRYDEAKTSLVLLQSEVTDWEARLPELLGGNTGKRIAASKIRVGQFDAVIERKRPSVTHVRSLRDQLEILFEAVDSAQIESNSLYSASDYIVSEIKKIADETRNGLDDMDYIKKTVDRVLTDSMNEAPAEKSLQSALNEMHAERIRQRIDAVARAKSEAYEQGTKALAEEAAKAEKDVADARKAALNAQTQLELQAIRQKTDELLRQRQEEAEAEKRRVEKLNRIARFDAEYPSIKDYLVPITSPGLKQFEGNWLRITSKKGPLSFAGLKGQLKKSENASFHFARNIYSENDRPHGAFPYLSTGGAGCTPENYEILFRIQDFIAEFGDIMVERKLLAP